MMTKRILSLLLAVLTVTVFLAGCGNSGNSGESRAENSTDFEFYRTKAVAGVSSAKTYFKINHCFPENKSVLLNEFENLPDIIKYTTAPEEVVFDGVTYTNRASSPDSTNLSFAPYSNNFTYIFRADSPNRAYEFEFLENTTEPIEMYHRSLLDYYDCYFPQPSVSLKTAEENVIKYINEVLNGVHKKNIDLSIYNKYHCYQYGSIYEFSWKRIVNGIVVHEIYFQTLHSGEILRWMVDCAPPEDVVKALPNLKSEEYLAIAREMVEEAYKLAGNEVTISNFDLIENYNVYDRNFSISYSHVLGKYVVSWSVRWEAAMGDLTENHQQKFFIPIE